jgi:hypothetical protein
MHSGPRLHSLTHDVAEGIAEDDDVVEGHRHAAARERVTCSLKDSHVCVNCLKHTSSTIGGRTHVVAVAHENGAVGPPERTRVQLRVGHRPDLMMTRHRPSTSMKMNEHVVAMEQYYMWPINTTRHDTTRHDTQHVYLAVVEGLQEGGPHHRRQLGRGHPSKVVRQLPVLACNQSSANKIVERRLAHHHHHRAVGG